jgi:carbamoyltransferase
MKVYLGTNYGHGSAVAVMSSNGLLLEAMEEGRLRAEKRYSGFPDLALLRVADKYGATVAGWSEGWDTRKRLLIKGMLSSVRFGWRDHAYLDERLIREFRRFYTGLGKYSRWSKHFGAVRYVGHHVAHALSLLPWGLPPDSLVVVSDYIGEQWSLSSLHWDGERLRLISRIPFPHSIGAAYHQLATHLGFMGQTGPGTLMALAGYGEPRWIHLLNDLVRWDGVSFRIDQRRFPVWKRRQAWKELGETVGGAFGSEVKAAKTSYEAGHDLASSAQRWFTETTWRYIEASLDAARSRMALTVRALGLAGGAALNCQANGGFIERLHQADLERLVVSPWSDDSGTAIGAAVHSVLMAERHVEFPPASPFLGPYLEDSPLPMRRENVVEAVHCLASGGIIALATGRLEFGPRALGGRCLLADPRSPDIRSRVNAMKGRRPFMPFAPAVLEEHSADYFLGQGSTNMAWTIPIRPEVRGLVPGVDHSTGRARVEIVDAQAPALLRAVLAEWFRHSGCAVLLLTSLNGSGEEIPDSAIRSLDIATRIKADGMLSDSGWLPL